MKLEHERTERYLCELTKRLDELADITNKEFYDVFHHYIYYDGHPDYQSLLPIRVPGGTVGSISLDYNSCITEIGIDTEYVVKTYAKDVEKIINSEFKGVKIEF